MSTVTEADLFLAILALDAYNRGYGPGMTFQGSSDAPGTQIGDATVEVATDDSESQNAGFYAVAYEWQGEFVISYRGTRFPSGPDWKDVVNGWTLSGGFSNATQAQMAFDFYTNVQLNFAGGVNGEQIELTGHSLGGGLAGFVADLTGAQAKVYNNIPFGTAVVAEVVSHDLSQGMSSPLFAFLGYDPVSGRSYETLPSSSANVQQFITTGEIATLLRATSGVFSYEYFLSQQLNPVTASALTARGITLDNTVVSQSLDPHIDFSGSLVDSINLHSQSLMVMLLYANLKDDTDWASVGRPLYDALYSDHIANAVGLKQTTGQWYGASAKMMAAIAYSAIDSGTMPFGDTGIQSLFNDADALGLAQSAGESTGLLSSDLTGTALSPVTGLMEIAVQFAADQAAHANTDTSLASGAFNLDGSSLKVDLDPSKWIATFQQNSSGPNTTAIVGVGDFFDGVLSNISARLSLSDTTYSWIANNLAGFSSSVLTQLNDITQVDVALGGGDLSAAGTLPNANDGTPGGAMLVGADGQGSLTGSDKGNDIIIGGATVKTASGDDLILAGGTETITLGKGNNQILTDNDATTNITLTYAGATGADGTGSGASGATGGASGSASPGTDLIITPAAGATYTFTNADQAAFTVVDDSAGNNTFNIDTSSSSSSSGSSSSGSSSPVTIVELNMSGISGDNLTHLDMKKLEDYVDQNYGLTKDDPVIVMLNPSTTSTITYNDDAVGAPQVALSGSSWMDSAYAGTSTDPNVVADEAGGWQSIEADMHDPLHYLTFAKYSGYTAAAYASASWGDYVNILLGADAGVPESVWGPELRESMAEGENPLGAWLAVNEGINLQQWYIANKMVNNTWNEVSQTDDNYALANQNFEYDLSVATGMPVLALVPVSHKITSAGGPSDSGSALDAHTAAGDTTYLEETSGSGLNLINFTSGDFGINLPGDTSAETSKAKDTEYEVLQGWAKGFDVPSPLGPAYGSNIYGTSPQQLGSVIYNSNPTPQSPQLYDPSFAGAPDQRATLNLADYLSGSSSSDPTNVTVAFFGANRALLDGQFNGFTVLDSATNVSSVLDALNGDSRLTGITLTDSGTPTLTLSVAQAFGDTTALGEIANQSYGIAIADTGANVSQNIDALNADQTISAIDLTDAATASLTLTVMQALDDSTALGKISNSAYTIAVSDTAQDVSSAIDVINSDAAVISITLSDSGTPTLSLTVAQTLGDTRALGEITNAAYGINVHDTAANILSNASALSADTHVTGAVVVDTAANVLDNADALTADTQVTSITVVDSVANIFGGLAALQGDAKVTSLVAIDTASNILANATALAGVSEITAIGVADTAANVSANFDALNAVTSLSAIMLTDSGTPALTLTAAQALDDTSALHEIANSSYAIDVVDTAAAVAASIDALGQLGGLAQITLTDAGSPTLTLTAAQAVNDAAVIARITNANARVVVSDTAANVVAQFDALNADAAVSAISLTDAGTPVLTLTIAQALDDTTALGKIENANAQITISDTAVDVSANFDALNADPALSSIMLSDSGTPTLVLTVAQATGDTGLLAKIANSSYTIAVFDSVANILGHASTLGANARISSIVAIDTVANILANSAALAAAGCTSQIAADSAANIAANLDLIDADASVKAISLTDSGTPTLSLTVAQTIADARALTKITNSTLAVDIVDSAANVSAAINTLNANGLIAAVTLTDAGTPTLSLNVAEFLGDTALLSKITNAGYTVDITDTAAAVAARVDTLYNGAKIGAITLTDSGTPVLTLSAEQALADTSALGLITNANYTVTVADTVANVLADATALAADARVSSITVVDTAANVLAAEGSLAGNPKVTSVTVVDTVANVLANADALANTSIATTLDVVDSTANVAANFDALNAASIAKITLTDANPILTLTAAQAATDYSALYEIANPSFAVAVVDTAANVSAYLDQLEYNQHLTSITLTDAGTPVLDLPSYSLDTDSGALGKITNPNYTINLVGAVNVSVASFLADQTILDTAPGGFAVSDLASNIAASLEALNADANVTAITLYSGYGGVGSDFVLSAAQATNDTRALGEITNSSYPISVADTADNILADSAALAANDQISSVVVQDTAANVLANAAALNADSGVTSITIEDTAANVLSDESALAVLTKPVSVEVKDTAAAVSAHIDQLNADVSLSAIVLTDAGTPTLTLTAAEAHNDSSALNLIAGTYAIAIADTAADISQNLDALSQISQISSTSVTDSAHLTLTLNVEEVINEFNLLSALTNASCDVAVVDTAANIQSNLDSLNADTNISSITAEGGGAPVIIVTAAEAAVDAGALGKLTNATVDVVSTDNISVAEFISEQSAIDSIGASFSILDTAANVSNDLLALDADANLSAITLSDGGIPTLTLTAAQAVQGAVALNAISNPSYTIAVTDTAAAVSNDFARLSSVPQITTITLSDPGIPALTLTAAELTDGAALLGEITNPTYTVTVNDTAANIANDLDSLNASAQADSITISDGGYLDLTVAQVLDDTAALGKIANPTYFIAVFDSAENIAANIGALSANAHIADVVPDEGAVPLTVAQALQNLSLLSKGSYSTNDILLPVPVAIVDTAANVAAALGALNRDASIVSITLTDGGTPVLNLTAAQAATDTKALGEIVGPYTINIVQGAAAVSVADFLANQSSLDAAGAIVIADSSENIAGSFDTLNADWHVESLTLTDNAPLALSAAQALGDAYALEAITNTGYTIAVADTAADVSGNIDALNADAPVSAITLTDAGTLTLTAFQALHDRAALGEITNSDYGVAIVDTAADVVDNFDALNDDARVSSITLSGSGTLVLTASEAIDDQALLGKITNSNVAITVLGPAADISANIDALNADARVTSIFLEDLGTPTLTLTVAQAFNDTAALGEISVPYAVAISDSAANVAASFDALNADGHVAAITLTDSGVPTLTLTAAQVQDDAAALGKIANASYVLSVVGTGSEIVDVRQTLQVANFAYDATDADWQLSGYGLAETLTNVAGVVDASGHRFLLVGGGSEFTTAEAAVAAASDGDTILLTPGSDATDVGTSGKAITVEDVGAAGTSDNAPLVTITSPAAAGNFGFSGGPTITGTAIPYGTAIVGRPGRHLDGQRRRAWHHDDPG